LTYCNVTFFKFKSLCLIISSKTVTWLSSSSHSAFSCSTCCKHDKYNLLNMFRYGLHQISNQNRYPDLELSRQSCSGQIVLVIYSLIKWKVLVMWLNQMKTFYDFSTINPQFSITCLGRSFNTISISHTAHAQLPLVDVA